MEAKLTRNILEACLMVAARPMNLTQLEALFESDIDRPDRNAIKTALAELQEEYEGRGIELKEVASGYRLQSRESMQHWVDRLFQERSPRYSRALLETLVLIAYRQPITRGEIEEIRGVAVSSNIIKTLQEREWVREVGHKEVPGRPALLGTTRQFLDYFNLKRLDELPSLGEIQDIAEIDPALAAEIGLIEGADDSVAANDGSTAAAGDAPLDGDPADENPAVDELVVDELVDESKPSNNELAHTESADGDDDGESSAARPDSPIDTEPDTEPDPTEPSPTPGTDTGGEAEAALMSTVDLELDDGADALPDAPADAPSDPPSDAQTDAPSDAPSDAQAELRRVIDDFAGEHQQQLDAEERLLRQSRGVGLTAGHALDDDADPAANDATLDEAIELDLPTAISGSESVAINAAATSDEVATALRSTTTTPRPDSDAEP